MYSENKGKYLEEILFENKSSRKFQDSFEVFEEKAFRAKNSEIKSVHNISLNHCVDFDGWKIKYHLSLQKISLYNYYALPY